MLEGPQTVSDLPERREHGLSISGHCLLVAVDRGLGPEPERTAIEQRACKAAT